MSLQPSRAPPDTPKFHLHILKSHKFPNILKLSIVEHITHISDSAIEIIAINGFSDVIFSDSWIPPNEI